MLCFDASVKAIEGACVFTVQFCCMLRIRYNGSILPRGIASNLFIPIL